MAQIEWSLLSDAQHIPVGVDNKLQVALPERNEHGFGIDPQQE